jgi:hypothetical protein
MTDKINTGIARKGDMQINPDGTKTMETGGEKMIYQ